MGNKRTRKCQDGVQPGATLGAKRLQRHLRLLGMWAGLRLCLLGLLLGLRRLRLDLRLGLCLSLRQGLRLRQGLGLHLGRLARFGDGHLRLLLLGLWLRQKHMPRLLQGEP